MGNKEKQTKEVARYTKEQLMGAEQFRDSQDVLEVALQDGIKYEKEEAQRLVDGFLRRRVK